jgi:LmbE family N-acetylglucosaminyl deacetylase
MTTLLVVAHPDDEVLGAGGYAFKLSSSGRRVQACILSGSVTARTQRPEDAELRKDTLRAQELLGMPEPILGGFPNIAFNTVPHLELVQFVERAMKECQAREVLTHHPGDLNDDHRYVSHAAQVAARLHQRNGSVPPLERLAYMEVLSSTDWAFPLPGQGFQPNAFVEIEREGVERKLEALAAYRGVMRPYPHPRSLEALEALAAMRGAQAGLQYAEAFQVVYQRMGG